MLWLTHWPMYGRFVLAEMSVLVRMVAIVAGLALGVLGAPVGNKRLALTPPMVGCNFLRDDKKNSPLLFDSLLYTASVFSIAALLCSSFLGVQSVPFRNEFGAM